MASASTWSLERLDALAEEVKAAIKQRAGNKSSVGPEDIIKEERQLPPSSAPDALSQGALDQQASPDLPLSASGHPASDPRTPDPQESESAASVPTVPSLETATSSDNAIHPPPATGSRGPTEWNVEAMVLTNVIGTLMAVNEVGHGYSFCGV